MLDVGNNTRKAGRRLRAAMPVTPLNKYSNLSSAEVGATALPQPVRRDAAGRRHNHITQHRRIDFDEHFRRI